jgi:hypothetical protein
MSRPVSQYWPVPNETAVAALQDLAAPGALVLNGTLSRKGVPLSFPQMNRAVSLTSANNLGAANFTIVGTTSSGIAVEEVMAGPNNNTVQSANSYHTITSITCDAAVNGISAGSGQSGYLSWNQYDYNRGFSSYLAIQVVVEGNITYTFGATLEDVSSVIDPYLFDVTTDLTNQNVDGTGTAVTGLRYYTTTINASDDTGALTVYYMQQGI